MPRNAIKSGNEAVGCEVMWSGNEAVGCEVMWSGNEAVGCEVMWSGVGTSRAKGKGCGQLTSRHCHHLSCDLTSDTKVSECSC